MTRLGWRVGLACGLALATGASAQELSREETARFLATADVVAAEPIGRGVTRPMRLTLSDGTITHDAAFQSVDESRDAQRLGAETERNFVDSYRYNIAAYRLAVRLGLGDMMPVTVERRWRGARGAISWWVDDVAFDESTRLAERRWPDDMARWTAQMYRMWVFAELVRDTDRNRGNILYTTDWSLVMLDFSRAFRLQAELQRPEELARCDRRLLETLRTLTEDDVREATGTYLTRYEIEAVLARRDLLVAHFDALVETKGDAVVLY